MPLFFTTFLVVAGCSSDGSTDLENADDMKDNEQSTDQEGSSDKKSNESSNDAGEGNSGNKDSKDGEDSSSGGGESDSDSDQGDSSSNSNDGSSEEGSANNSNSEEGSNSDGGGSATGDNSSDDGSANNSSNEPSGETRTFTFSEVNGNAVNILTGVNGVEIKLKDIKGATAKSSVYLKANDKKIDLTFNRERGSFRNIEITQADVDQLKNSKVVVKG